MEKPNPKPVDILGIGSALVDILVRCPEDFLLTHGFEKGRMHLIDAERAAALQAETTAGREASQLVSGGSAANTCLGIASFGADETIRAAFLGGVGSDALGTLFADDLAQAGVSFTNIAEAGTTAATGFCICFITPDGERTMATYLGASGSFDASFDIEAQAAAAQLLYVEGYIWDTEVRVAIADHAIRAAKAAGGKVALTVSDAWCADAYRAHFLRYCAEGLVDILFANEAEIMALTQTHNFESAVSAAASLVKIGVFTRSAKGAVIQEAGQLTTIAAIPVAKVVDATGAGDLFAAGFLYGHLMGLNHAEAGRLGARAASVVISQIGARPQIMLSTLKEAA